MYDTDTKYTTNIRCDLNTPLILLPFPKLELHIHNCFWEVCQTFQRSLLILKCKWKCHKSPLYFSTYYSCSCCRQPSPSRKRFTAETQFLLTVTSRQTLLRQETLMQRKRLRSAVWHFFTRSTEAVRTSQCTICSDVVKHANHTSNLFKVLSTEV